MADKPPEPDPEDESSANRGPLLGAGIALGAGLGVVMMAVTGEAYWIAIGAGIGVALGAAFQSRRRD